jgi:hypothetical protein
MTDTPYQLRFFPFLRLGLGADAKAGEIYLFDVPQTTVAKLVNGLLPAELTVQFQSSGIILSQQAKAEKQSDGTWKITDSEKVYLIRSDGTATRAYELDKLHRSKFVRTVVKNQADTTLWIDSHSAVLRGPGDVVGFHEHLIARTEPIHGATDFESNYFPFIEFKDPDFPWRFSLGTPNAVFQLLPWIVLLVLPGGSFTVTQRARNDRQRVDVLHVEDAAHQPDQKSPLPDLQFAWAWAHVHFSAGSEVEAGDISDSLSKHPEMNCSRLVCLRHLDPRTSYSAFVVPLYEIGRRAGLGEPLFDPGGTEDPGIDQPWKADGAIDLPIYYRWDFQTCEEGDFETLLHKIKPGSCPDTIGRRKVDGGAASDADFLPHTNDGDFDLEGALLPVGQEPSTTPEPREFSAAVAGELGRALASADSREDPLVTIPVYGQHYKRLYPDFFQQADAGTGQWIRDLNLNRGNRIPGGMGTQVVQMNQEEYMDLCWKQVGAIREANEEIRRAATGAMIGERLQTRHLDPLEYGRFLSVMEPFHHYAVSTAGTRGITGESFKRRFARTGVPWGVLSHAGRKALVQRARLHPSGTGAQKPFTQYLQSRLSPAQTAVRSPAGTNPRFELRAASTLRADTVTVAAFPDGEVKSFRNNFNLRTDILSRLNGMITRKTGQPAIDCLEPRLAAPTISRPMYEHLAARSLEFLLPNLKDLQNNTVVLMAENRKFIEAYMVGLNHEMGRELVWREYPTDRRGTIFSHFWDSIGPDAPKDDILPIDTWKSSLGGNKPPDVSSGSSHPPIKNRVIFAVKADLIRRYPDALFYTVKCDLPDTTTDQERKNRWEGYFKNSDRENSTDGFSVFEPEISAKIGNDTLFLGYPIERDEIKNNPKKYYFVIAQIPSLPRFGLDDTAANASGSVEDFSWGQVNLGSGNWINLQSSAPSFNDATWNSAAITSAGIAYFTLQLPVRLVIPTARLLKI